MSNWNSKLMDAYRLAAWPMRRWQYWQMKSRGTLPVYSVSYHRVADTQPNSKTIRRGEFERQIDWLQGNFEIVDLQECQRRIRGGFNIRPTLSITFNGGYQDNCDFAMPLLIERRIPVTYFVSTYHCCHQKPLRQDLAQNNPLPINSIESLRELDMAGVEIGGSTRHHVDLGEAACDEQVFDEVVLASREMESLIGRSVRYFAFPFGNRINMNAKVFSLLRNAGFLGVCSGYGGWNSIGEDEFHIQRIPAVPDLTTMKKWLSFDARVGQVPRFEYQNIGPAEAVDSSRIVTDRVHEGLGGPRFVTPKRRAISNAENTLQAS